MANKLRWGVLGSSRVARSQLIPAIQQSQSGTVVGLASRNPTQAKVYSEELSIAQVFSSYDALLATADIDIVYIPLPTSLHAEWAVRAAEAGKAILCEKPLATTAQDAVRMVEACAKYRVPMMEGFMYRFHPQHQRVFDLIAQGKIGEVREIRVHLSVNHMAQPDYSNIRFKSEMGGGVLLDMGPYTTNLPRWIFGEEPKSVLARWDIDPQCGCAISLSGILDFSGGRTASISCSFGAGGQGSYTVIGTKGLIEVPRAFLPGIGPRLGETLVIVVDPDGRRFEETIAPANQYLLMIESFGKAILEGAPVPNPPQDGVCNMKVLDALASAARQRRAVQVE